MKLSIIIPTLNNKKGLKILLTQLKDYENVFVIKDKGQGITKCWNEGIQKAQGSDYVAIFNDDIELPKNWWDECFNNLKNGIDLLFLKQSSPIIFTGWFFILSKRCIETIGIFDEDMRYFAQDYDYWLRFKKSGLKYDKIDLNIIHHSSVSVSKKSVTWYKENWNNDWLALRKKHPNVRLQEQLK